MTGEGQRTLAGEAGGGWSGLPASVLGLCSGLTWGGAIFVLLVLGDCPDTVQAEHPWSWPSCDNPWNWDIGLGHAEAF